MFYTLFFFLSRNATQRALRGHLDSWEGHKESLHTDTHIVSSTVITRSFKLAAPTYGVADQQSPFIVIWQKRWFNLSGVRSQKWAVTAFARNFVTESAIPTGCGDVKEIHGQRYDLLLSPHQWKSVVFVSSRSNDSKKTMRQALTWHLGW